MEERALKLAGRLFGLVQKRLRKQSLPPEERRDMALLADEVAGKVMRIAQACEVCGYASADNVLVDGSARCAAHKDMEGGEKT